MRIICPDHTNWRVRDHKASLAFHEDDFGFEPFDVEEYERGERPLASLRITRDFILYLVLDVDFEGVSDGGYDHLAFTVEGAEIERRFEGIVGVKGRGPGVYIRDPDEYRRGRSLSRGVIGAVFAGDERADEGGGSDEDRRLNERGENEAREIEIPCLLGGEFDVRELDLREDASHLLAADLPRGDHRPRSRPENVYRSGERGSDEAGDRTVPTSRFGIGGASSARNPDENRGDHSRQGSEK